MHSKDISSLFHNNWGWEYLKVGGSKSSKAYSLTCMAGDAGCRLGARPGCQLKDLHGVSASTILSFLGARWLSSQSKCLRRQEVVAASFLRLGPRNCYSVTPAIFFWPSSHRAQIQGERTYIPSLGGMRDKEFGGRVLNLPQRPLIPRLPLYSTECEFLYL